MLHFNMFMCHHMFIYAHLIICVSFHLFVFISVSVCYISHALTVCRSLSVNNNNKVFIPDMDPVRPVCTHAISFPRVTSSNIHYSRAEKHTSSHCIDLKVISCWRLSGICWLSLCLWPSRRTHTSAAHRSMGWLCLQVDMSGETTNKHARSHKHTQYLFVTTVVNRATTIVLFSNKRKIMV